MAGVSLGRERRRSAIGVLRRQLDDPDLTPGVRDRVREALEALAAAGFELVDVDLPELDLVDEALGAIVLREAWDVHRELYEREADGYGPGTRMLLELGAKVSDDDYRAALADKERVTAAFARALRRRAGARRPDRRLPGAARGSAGRHARRRPRGRASPAPYNVAGVPAISVPCGLADGALPAGLQLAAAAGNDALLLSVAEAYEEVAP